MQEPVERTLSTSFFSSFFIESHSKQPFKSEELSVRRQRDLNEHLTGFLSKKNILFFDDRIALSEIESEIYINHYYIIYFIIIL